MTIQPGSSTVAIGNGAIPVYTGAPGRGVKSISYDVATSSLIATMSDGTHEDIPMPIGGTMTDGAPAPGSIALSQDVINYVTGYAAKIAHTHLHGDITDWQKALYDSVSQVLKAQGEITLDLDPTAGTVTIGGGQDITVSGSGLITVTKTGNNYDVTTTATKNETDAHLLDRANHTGTQAIDTVADLQDALDAKVTQPTTKMTGWYVGWDGTDWVMFQPGTGSGAVDLSPYLLKADASSTYATTTTVNGKITAPSATNGQMLTYNGTSWVAQNQPDLSTYLLKTDAANLYAPKTHTHVIADVTNLQTTLDGKIAKPATATSGQVLTYDGTTWAAVTPAAGTDTSTLVPKSAYTAKGDLLVGTAAGTYAALAAPPTANRQLITDGSGSATWAYAQAQTVPFSMTGTVAVKTGTGRFYNDLGSNRVITTLRASVGTAPAGSALTVAVKVDGTQVGAVTIPSGLNTATTAGLSAAFNSGSYVTVDVTAVGSTTPGSDLVVAIIHRGA